MGRDLQAEVLTISIPFEGCNKKCGYCVSRMTGETEKNIELWRRNLKKAETMARTAGCSTVLITGKGEPLHPVCRGYLEQVGTSFGESWPLEIQTNGGYIEKALGEADVLYNLGFNVIAVSMDSEEMFDSYHQVWKTLVGRGLVARITVNVNDQLGRYSSLADLLEYCRKHGVSQLTVRRLSVPVGLEETEQAGWIEEHAPEDMYHSMVGEGMSLVREEGREIRRLAHGVTVYDVGGVAFVHSDYCIQESDEGVNLRSLIYQEDGHMYTSWNSRASILF
jgi:molybdenum cofactor biosynthesis enzyme MoaA